eukprot:5615438-Prorocentrum_lima.AAC.1
MTSSLVGSEMCIRDRPEVEEDRQRFVDFLLSTDSRALNTRFAKPTHKPVSYTHLTLPTICSV